MANSRAERGALSAERDLISRALQGDGLAFRRLVEPHLPVLLRIATRVSGSAHLAEDVVQETLALSYARLSRYRPQASFRAYLAAIAARQAHTMVRAERRRSAREQAAREPTALATPEQQLQLAATAARVRDALMAMPKKRREAALLRLDGGLSYREISEALGSSEGSARVLVHNALKQLRQQLADVMAGTREG